MILELNEAQAALLRDAIVVTLERLDDSQALARDDAARDSIRKQMNVLFALYDEIGAAQ